MTRLIKSFLYLQLGAFFAANFGFSFRTSQNSRCFFGGMSLTSIPRCKVLPRSLWAPFYYREAPIFQCPARVVLDALAQSVDPPSHWDLDWGESVAYRPRVPD